MDTLSWNLVRRCLVSTSLVLLSAPFSGFGMAEEPNFRDVLDPEVTRLMIETGGFEISDAGDGSIIAIKENNSIYNIYTRFLVWDEDGFEGRDLDGEVYSDDVACTTYIPQDEEFKPIEICFYSVELNQNQIISLSEGRALVSEFFDSINQVNAIPAIGGRFVTNPIQVNTFNLNMEINLSLLKASTRVWANCWNADPYSDNFVGFQMATMRSTENCEAAKLDYRAVNNKAKDESLIFSRIMQSEVISGALDSDTLHTFASQPSLTWGRLLEAVRN